MDRISMLPHILERWFGAKARRRKRCTRTISRLLCASRRPMISHPIRQGRSGSKAEDFDATGTPVPAVVKYDAYEYRREWRRSV